MVRQSPMTRAIAMPVHLGRAIMLMCFVFVALAMAGNSVVAQTNENFLKNGTLEEDQGGKPADWLYPRGSASGYVYAVDTENPFEGDQSAMVDGTNPTKPGSFAVFNQMFDAKPFQGKKVRFRAAVRTAERDSDQGQAQLWLRVDRANGEMGAFDNMGDRPVKSDDWQQVEIVVAIDKDAERLTVGMLVIGKAKAWIDDASLEIVDDDTKTTVRNIAATARTASKDAPTQPFFNAWLLLAGLVVAILFYANARNSFLQRFALRFSIAYWVFYCFPTLLGATIRGITGLLDRLGWEVGNTVNKPVAESMAWFPQKMEELCTWTANNVLGIDGQLVSSIRNGSGDTTMAYVKLFVGFVFAFAIATIWSLAFIKRTKDHVWLRDMLRTYLRYVLAVTMLGYGLAKTGFIFTQFAQGGVPNEFQLNRTYGDSSPMGLLWTFMAASPGYTFFAGMGEVLGGVLLVFRRTMTLGALVTFGVLFNVMMLNFCYDVPVKQYSFHLGIMALVIAAPDFLRLANVLFFNRATQPTALLTPPYAGPRSIWVHRVVKGIIVISLFAIPIYQHAKKEITYEHPETAESEHLLIKRGFRWINETPYNR